MENQNLPVLPFQYGDAHNFVFLAEAGAGKSEVSVNMALYLASLGEKPVHFFDLDMTKPLFRSRDLASFLTEQGVIVHFEEQFYDAPTVSGGVSRLLRDENCYTVLDVGGDYIGARSIGGYAPFLNKPDTIVWYVVNPYRPWSMDLPHIDAVLSQVLGVSHVQLDRLRFLGNPNLGPDTSPEDVVEGINSIRDMIEAFKPVDFYTVREEIAPEVEALFPGKIFPIRLYLTYEWV
ncbi:MAG: hypothetical protein IJ237_09540 [Oscillospiraceae bacterium]|nr:hypothetical protein [Oscillospiraceae bacterium]